MRLIDLEPRWFTFSGAVAGTEVLIGLSFLCPHCRVQRLAVRFKPAIDPEANFAKFGIVWPWGDDPVWDREGDTFETLSLSPSVNAGGDRIDFKGHWHGHIKNGQIV